MKMKSWLYWFIGTLSRIWRNNSHEHAEEGYEMGTTILSQCWSGWILPLSAPWTFCRTSCLTPDPKYPRIHGHGCAAGAGPGLWTFPSVPRQRCNTHRQHLIPGTSGGDSEHKAGVLQLYQSDIPHLRAGRLICGIYWHTTHHRVDVHTQNLQTQLHPPSAPCSSCSHCCLRSPCNSRGWNQSYRDQLSSSGDPGTVRSHLQGSAPQLSTLQSSWLCCSLSSKDKPPWRVCTPGLLP